MNSTNIEWADITFNPMSGCTPISIGCDNCYAKRMAYRLKGRVGYPEQHPFAVTLHPNRVNLKQFPQKQHKRIFTGSMGDLFHPEVPDHFLCKIWHVFRHYHELHTFMVLTKRPQRMADFVSRLRFDDKDTCKVYTVTHSGVKSGYPLGTGIHGASGLQNVWLGTTIEAQQYVDMRMSYLLKVPAAIRFISVEPMLSPINIEAWLNLDIHWVICGAETGPNARYMNPEWAFDLLKQCKNAGVPFFMKQMSGKTHIPPELMIREYPKEYYYDTLC